jgi:hypothetical protein
MREAAVIIGCHRMSRNVWAALLLGTFALGAAGRPAAQIGPGCRPDDDAALARAAAAAAEADADAAAAILREAYAASPACGTLGTASWAWHGWLAAARAHAAGGTEESLAAVRAALAVLEPGGNASSLGAAYAAAMLHAAAAAAQHERGEMQVWLEHAAGLAGRLVPGERPWPMAPAVAEGELWLLLRDPALADAAFQRAVADGETPVALRGLGRARSSGDNMTGGCEPYRRALALVEATSPDGPLAVEARAFLRLCR